MIFFPLPFVADFISRCAECDVPFFSFRVLDRKVDSRRT